MSDFYTRMKAYREKICLSQKKLAEKVNVSRETIVRLERGQYNPSLRLAVNIAGELHAEVEDIFVFADSREQAEVIFERRDESMLERESFSLFDQGFQEGFEEGVSQAALDMLTGMIGYVMISMSEEKWERYKKSEEKKNKNFQKSHPDQQEVYDRCFDRHGHLVREKWIKQKKDVMGHMNFPENAWEDLCAFVEKYPGLPAGALARRVLKESEYKYI